VLHVVNSLDPGGMENGVVNMARHLEPAGFDIHVACLERRGAFAARLPGPDRTIVLGKGAGFTPGAAFALSRTISRLRPGIIHSHNLGPLIYSALATLGGCRAALVQGEHAHLTPGECSPRRLLQRRAFYRACRAIHTVSQPMREELVKLGFPAEKVTVIANGVDAARFQPGNRAAARAAFGIPPDSIVIGIVARFGAFKRHDALLAAFERVGAEFPSAHLLMAGSGGSEEACITDLARNSPLRSRVHLTGFQPDPVATYQALDLLALPSTNEGMSNAALEAMACGVPVLGNTGCGHEQIIDSGSDGWIADLGSVESLATGIGQRIGNPQALIDIGRNARRKIQARFSIDSMAAAYANFYRTHARPPH
jgi:glycosyltransferase involved in cell wall biosynthesis